MPPDTCSPLLCGDDDYYQKLHRAGMFHARGDHPLFYRALVRTLAELAIARLPLVGVGCGEGFFLARAKLRFWFPVGLEPNEQGVRYSRVHSDCPVIQGDAQQLPFRSNSAGVVVALDVVEHLRNPESFLHDAHRVLIFGGILCLTTPNPESWGHRRKGGGWHGYRDPTHIHIQPIDYWRSLLATSGFSVVQDGTDYLWDVPYLRYLPDPFQRLVFIGTQQIVHLRKVCLPRRLGGNYVCITQESSIPPNA